MTERGKRTDAEVWQALEKVAAEVGELERIDALSDDELDRELRAAGIDPAEAAKLGEGLRVRAPPLASRERPQAPAPRERSPRPPRKVQWVPWGALAAVVLVAAVLARRPDDAASPWPGDHGADSDALATKHAAAAKLRDDAFGACAQGLWGACEEKLNAARALDPSGEQDAKVLAARRAVYDAEHADAGPGPDKPVP